MASWSRNRRALERHSDRRSRNPHSRTPHSDRRIESMLRRPDVEEVAEYGRALGFDLTPLEARMIQERMMGTIAALEDFDEMRVEERRPPLRFTDRDPGARPSAAEDPHGVFIRRCRVKGADGGPLA